MSTHGSSVPLGEKIPQHPKRFSAEWFLEHYGGSYLGIVLFLMMLISFPIAALSLFFIQLNAHFSGEHFIAIAGWGAIFVCLGDILLMVLMYLLTRDARQRLDRWMGGKPLPGGQV